MVYQGAMRRGKAHVLYVAYHPTRMSRVHELTDKGNVPCMNDQASSLLGVKKVGFKQHF